MKRNELNLRREARRAAKRYGIDPRIFVRQIEAESNFDPDAVSPAGASGVAQIMPATARGWGVDPMNPVAALDAAAKNMARYVKAYGGYENALRAYNAGPGAIQASRGYAETNAYVQKILGGLKPRNPTDRGQRAMIPAGGKVTNARMPKLVPGGTQVNKQGALVAALLDRRKGLGLMQRYTEQVNSGNFTTTTPARVEPGKPARYIPGKDKPAQGKSRGRASKPGGGYAGSANLVNYWDREARKLGLTETSAKRSTSPPGSAGTRSDHYVGQTDAFANDWAGPQPAMQQLASRIARSLGVKNFRWGQTVEVTRGGYRHQLIASVHGTGPHVHYGVKRV